MKRNTEHLGLLADTGQIASLVNGSADLQSFLERCADMIAKHLNADVCSIYLLEDSSGDLVLRANTGLNHDVVDQYRLAIGEGLVGTALKELRPIHTSRASEHPDFRLIPGSGEERFDTFLGVPIIRGIERIGVLVVQRADSNDFDEAEVKAMQVLTAQMAAAIENARVLLTVSNGKVVGLGKAPALVSGKTVSPGCATGVARVFKRDPAASILKRRLAHNGAEHPNCSLDRAIEVTLNQLEEGQLRLGERLPEAASLIFESHLMMLKDVGFVGRIRERIEEDGLVPGRAVAQVAADYIALFENSEHDYLREKAKDVEDLAIRILDNLASTPSGEAAEEQAHIVIARELLPSDILRIAQGNVQGIVLVSGGSTAHVSLLVRSLGIPMIIIGTMELLNVLDGERIIVDGFSGNVYVNPSEQTIESYDKRRQLEARVHTDAARMADKTTTKDGVTIHLLANINLLSELDLALALKAEGVGLYRTEFPFLVHSDLPSENDQHTVYARLLDRMEGRPVTFRTLDAGGDKVLSYFDSAGEANPALGLRSTRFSLKYPKIFDQQLRAILRAADERHDVRVMFPMIGSIEEMRQARRRIEGCAKELAREGIPITMPGVGMMVELPAVVELADEFAAEAEFFSIGTNDFIQYMLAVDRTNEQVASYYCPHHPSVLRGLNRIVSAALRRGIEVSVCGEMAHDVRYVPFFVGIGVRTLSVEPNCLPHVQAVVSRFTHDEAVKYARDLLDQTLIAEVEARLLEPESLGLE